MVSVLERAAPEFWATVYFTVLEPVPDAFFVIVIQLALLTAVQEALDGLADTVTLPAPPDAEKFAEEALNVNAADAGACVTVRVWPAMVSEPLRGL